MPSRDFLKRENILAIVAVLGVWSFLIQFTASQKSLNSETGLFSSQQRELQTRAGRHLLGRG